MTYGHEFLLVTQSSITGNGHGPDIFPQTLKAILTWRSQMDLGGLALATAT
jgi:hypothetical protein